MANTLTGLIPTIYEAMDIVSRELVGFVPSVSKDTGLDGVAKDQTIRVPVSPTSTAADVTPGLYAPDTGNQTIGYTDMTISKVRAVPIRWNGDEQRGLGNQYQPVIRDQFAQAMRVLANEIETDLAGLHVGASRAYGTAGTTPFASTLADPAQVRKILADNGAPMTDLQMVINTTAGAALRSLAQLTKANEAASDATLRRGVLLDLHGFAIRESAQVATSTAGTMASATTSSAALTVGQTVLPLATAGTGVVAAGDIITLANDTNQYVVTSVSFAGANPASGDTITIAAPGLRKAQGAATRNIAVVAAAARNLAFDRQALKLLTRLPLMPEGGDMADDVMVVTDPVSGLSFQVAAYRQYRQVHYEVGIAWGVKLLKPAHTAILLG